jgi:hypothetical protein
LYLENRQPSKPALPSIPDAKSYRSLADGTVGELDFQLLLRQYLSDEAAHRIAPRWRGGQFKLYESKQERRPLLAFTSEWDDAAAAKEFFDAYRTVLTKKWSKAEFREEGSARLAGSGDRGGFVVTLEGAVVSSVEGTPDGTVN